MPDLSAYITVILAFLKLHWKAILLIYVLSNIVSAMPSPNGKGALATWWYKWVFAALHGVFGNFFRIVATLFPKWGWVQKIMGFGGSDTPTTPPPPPPADPQS